MKRMEHGGMIKRAMAALEEFGDLTGAEVADILGVTRFDAHAALTKMKRRTKAGIKRAHVVRYVYDNEGDRRYPRPVYRLGDRYCVSKPKSDPYAIAKKYRDAKSRRMRATSVFHLASRLVDCGAR